MFLSKRTGYRKYGRKIKQLYYRALGLLGGGLFNLLRLVKILARMEPFDRNKVRRILVIRMDRIGDVVLTTPTLRAIRKDFPEATVALLVRSYTKDLMLNNPNINELLIFQDQRIFLFELMRQLIKLKSYAFDLVIILHPNFWANFLSFASRATYRLGYDAAGSGFFLTMRISNTRLQNPRHEVEANLDVVRNIGVDITDKHLEVSVTDEGESFAQDFLKDNAIQPNDILIAVHPGGYYHYTRWPTAGFAQVCDSLIDRYKAKVMLVGSLSEMGLVREILREMRNAPLVVAGKTSLTQLISLLKRSSLFIGNASGPMHICCALNVPVVAIFGNTVLTNNYQKWGPWGEGHIVVSRNLDCANCQPADCLSLDCMRLITANDVCQAAEIQLRKNKLL